MSDCLKGLERLCRKGKLVPSCVTVKVCFLRAPFVLLQGSRTVALNNNSDHVIPLLETPQDCLLSSIIFPGTVKPTGSGLHPIPCQCSAHCVLGLQPHPCLPSVPGMQESGLGDGALALPWKSSPCPFSSHPLSSPRSQLTKFLPRQAFHDHPVYGDHPVTLHRPPFPKP